MKPRQWSWRWLLIGAIPLALIFLLLLPILIGDTAQVSSRIAATLSAWTGGKVSFTGPLRIRYFPDVSVRGALVMQDTKRLPLVRAVTTKQAKITLDLGQLLLGHLRIDSLRLVRPRITLKTDAISAETPQAIVSNLLSGGPIGALHIRDGRIDLQSPSGHETIDNLYGHFDLDDANASRARMSGFGSFEFRREEVQFTAEATFSNDTLPDVTLDLASSFGRAHLRGNASFQEGLSLDGPVELDIADTRGLLRWLGVDIAKGQSLKTFAAVGTGHVSGASLAIDDGTFTLDGNKAVGVLAITAGQRPHVEGTLDFDRFVTDPYLPEPVSDDVTASLPDSGTDPLSSWILLRSIDADLRISAREIVARSTKFGNGGFTITAKDGTLATEIGEVEMCEGAATGRLSVEPGSLPRALITASFKDVALRPCMEMLGLGIPLDGTGRIEAELGGEGRDARELLQHLLGTVTITAQHGLLPVDLQRLMRTPTPIDADSWSPSRGMAFETLQAECRLAETMMWCRRLDIRGPAAIVQGSGDIDLAQGSLDWRLDVGSPVNEATDNAAHGLTSISIRGPAEQPIIRRADRPTLGDGSTPQTGASPVQ
jgi:AsmA protein